MISIMTMVMMVMLRLMLKAPPSLVWHPTVVRIRYSKFTSVVAGTLCLVFLVQTGFCQILLFPIGILKHPVLNIYY